MAITLLETNIMTDVATATFTNTVLTTTYRIYLFKFRDINPQTDDVNLTLQWNHASQTGYDEQITTTYGRAYNNEANNSNDFVGSTTFAQAGTLTQDYAVLADQLGNDSDSSLVGELWFYDPAGTLYRPDYYCRCSYHHSTDRHQTTITTGMSGSGDAIDAIQFKMSSGNMDGRIALFGIGAEI